jgi:hypothetical protein
MSMMQIAMMGKVPYTVLQNGVFAHPTLAESLNNLFATIEMGKGVTDEGSGRLSRHARQHSPGRPTKAKH